MVGDVAVAEVQYRRTQPIDAAVHDHTGMRLDAAAATAIAPKEPHRPVAVNRPGVVMPEMVEDTMNPVAVGGARCADRAHNLAREVVRRLLIGVEQQDPFATRMVEGDLFLADVTGERLIEDLSAEAFGDFDGAVGRIRIDYD